MFDAVHVASNDLHYLLINGLVKHSEHSSVMTVS